ncbi:MAG: carboxypeptidase-like regulatory domain-containing protein [Bacteroidales bacterium]|nr:carboxypeptidase-like regulatory domain-containing protein [Bacteroidales bacterium]
MKKIIGLSILALFLISSGVYANFGKPPKEKQPNDTITYTAVTAKIIDEASKEPIVFASVFRTGQNIGTVSNSDGEFILKIPGKNPTGTISIAHIGYKNKDVSVKELLEGKNTIKLEQHAIPMEELVFKKLDPEELLQKAIEKKRDNYSDIPEMQTGFYRETIKQNRHYVSVSEAVLDIYNSGYKDNFDFDRVKIYKGRKSKDVKRMDTVLVKFQGGPRTAMFLDLVKNPGVILDPELFPYYKYKLNGIIKVNDRNNYVIEFDQKLPSEYPLYQGKIFLDVESYAVTSVDFRLSEKSLEDAQRVLIKKKPAGMKVEVVDGYYRVSYREIEGKWVLNYVRSEVDFRMKWKQRLFNKNINTMFEMAITDRDTENIERFPYKVSVKYSDFLADQVEAFDDKDYWGEYNYIKPDESIEVAIKKLSKKLQR